MKMGILASLVLAGSLATPVHADVRYTTRVQVRQTRAADGDATAAQPLLAKVGKQVVDVIAPGGSTEFVVSATAEAMRIQYRDGTAGIPKGGILLMRTDGTSVVLDPATRTYWNVTRPQPRLQPLLVFDVPPARTGESKRVSGVRAERVTFKGRLDLKQSNKPLPPDLLNALQLEGDVWVTDRIQAPPGVSELTSPALRALGVNAAVGNGFVMRHVLRGPLLGNQEIESLIVKIDSKRIAPKEMQIPEGYTRVEPPSAR